MAKIEDTEKQKLFFSFFYPGIFVVLLWIIEIIERVGNWDFGSFGIYPRELYGLKGIFFSPLIHSDFNHLINNSIPLFILGSCLFYFYRSLAFRVVILSWISSGFYTWISARIGFHIGASGLVYSLFGFILISGFLRRSSSLIGISFLVAFLYGSMVWGILPWDQQISWEGHLWGLFIGVVLAIFYRKKGPPRKKYSWDYEEEEIDEKSENGILEDRETSEKGNLPNTSSNENNTGEGKRIIYHFKENEK